MEVILLEDVRTLGKKGQIVKINDGYARNYVIPKKLGIEATPKNLNDLKLQKKREEKEAAEELAMAKELAATIEDKSVTVYMKTGEGGRTFGTISTKEVAAAVKEQLGLEVDKKKMKLKDAGFPQIIVDNHHTSVHHHPQRCDRIPRAINHFFFFITAFLRPQTGQHLPDSRFSRASKQRAVA